MLWISNVTNIPMLDRSINTIAKMEIKYINEEQVKVMFSKDEISSIKEGLIEIMYFYQPIMNIEIHRALRICKWIYESDAMSSDYCIYSREDFNTINKLRNIGENVL